MKSLLCQNTQFEKKGGKRWTYIYPNNVKAQLNYLLINQKWINSALNYEAYSSFDVVSFNRRIVTVNIQLKLRRNKKQTVKTSHYEWSSLTKRDISNKYIVTIKKKFDALQVVSENISK